MANILYFGDNSSSSTSGHRAAALSRLGHTISIHDPYQAVASHLDSKLPQLLHYRTGYRFLQHHVVSWVSRVINTMFKPDLVWVDSGELFGPTVLRSLEILGCPVVLYNVDDPTGKRDGRRFDSLKQALSLYDLVVVVRKETEQECIQLGAKRTMWVFRSYDEVAHHPFATLNDIPDSFRSEVAFIGTWMRHEKRDEFVLDLLNQGVPLSIWGDRWPKSAHWRHIEPVYRGGALGGRDYVAAIQGAKLCLGLLSKGNRDLHTTRSLEVPYAGGLLCAQRTTEHLELYQEGVEAVFWSDAGECARVCKELLNNDPLRESIRVAGKYKVESLGLGNEDVCNKIVQAILTQDARRNFIEKIS